MLHVVYIIRIMIVYDIVFVYMWFLELSRTYTHPWSGVLLPLLLLDGVLEPSGGFSHRDLFQAVRPICTKILDFRGFDASIT